MKLDELIKKHHLLQDEEGRYYLIDKQGQRREPYGTVHSLAELFGLSRFNLRNLIKDLTFKILRPQQGPLCKYFNLNEVNCTTVPKILNLPRAINDRVIIENQEFVALDIIAAEFSICTKVILSYVEENSIEVLKMIADGSIKDCYPRIKVEEIMGELLSMPIINNECFALYNGQRYASKERLASVLNIPTSLVQRIIKEKNLKGVDVRTPRGFALKAFSEFEITESVLRERKIPLANESGAIIIDGEEYTTIYRLSIDLGVHYSVVARKIQQSCLESKTIKSYNGQLRHVYKTKDVSSLFSEGQNQLPIADKSGIVTISDKSYATCSKLHKLWHINEINIKKRLQTSQIDSVEVKMSKYGPQYTAYNIEEAKVLCSDLLVKKRRRKKLTKPAKT